MTIIAKIPVSELFGFDAKLKSLTSGRGFYSLVDIVFEKLPDELREQTIKSIRKRKGLPEEIPKAEAEPVS
jgi:elongation factor 2